LTALKHRARARSVRALDKNLTVLSDGEELVLYRQPGFNDFKRA
jgi:hypothetical protein